MLTLNKQMQISAGETKRTSACKIYNCVGDFNEGVRLIITAEDTCYTPKPLNVGSSVTVDDVTSTTEMTLIDVVPPTPPTSRTTERTVSIFKSSML